MYATLEKAIKKPGFCSPHSSLQNRLNRTYRPVAGCSRVREALQRKMHSSLSPKRNLPQAEEPGISGEFISAQQNETICHSQELEPANRNVTQLIRLPSITNARNNWEPVPAEAADANRTNDQRAVELTWEADTAASLWGLLAAIAFIFIVVGIGVGGRVPLLQDRASSPQPDANTGDILIYVGEALESLLGVFFGYVIYMLRSRASYVSPTLADRNAARRMLLRFDNPQNQAQIQEALDQIQVNHDDDEQLPNNQGLQIEDV